MADAGPPSGDEGASVEDEMDVIGGQEIFAPDAGAAEIASPPKPRATRQSTSLSSQDEGGCGLGRATGPGGWGLTFLLWLGWLGWRRMSAGRHRALMSTS